MLEYSVAMNQMDEELSFILSARRQQTGLTWQPIHARREELICEVKVRRQGPSSKDCYTNYNTGTF